MRSNNFRHPKFAFLRLSVGVLALLVLAILAQFDSKISAGQDLSQDVEADLAKWVQQLDAPKFEVRERASQQLIRQGSKAIPVVAAVLATGTPEASWRAKRVLEQIGYANEGDTMTQVAALLAVKFPQFRFTPFQSKWRKARRDQAVQRLRKRGIKITVFPSSEQTIEQIIPVLGPGLIGAPVIVRRPLPVPDDALLPDGPEQQAETEPNPESNEDLTPELKKQAEFDSLSLSEKFHWILEKKPSENRELIDRLSQDGSRPQAPSVVSKRSRQTTQRTDQASLVLDENWSGDPEDLKELEVWSIEAITCANLKINRKLLSAIVVHQPSNLTFESCQFVDDSDQAAPEVGSPRVSGISLAFMGVKQTGQALLMMGGVSRLPITRITINGGSFDALACQQLRKYSTLRWVSLTGLSLDGECLEQLGKLPYLSMLSVRDCKMAVADMRRFRLAKPDIEVMYSASAFLGVGGKDVGEEVIITQVVPGSAASVAGVKIGDWIQQVDGTAIRKFEELRLIVSQFKPGDTVQLKVFRDGSELKLEARLEENLQPVLR